MSIYVGRHPVYVSHAREVEDLLDFVTDLQKKLLEKKLASGRQYDCLIRVQRKCRDLLLKLDAEDSEIMLMDDVDLAWMKKIVGFVKDVVPKDANAQKGATL